MDDKYPYFEKIRNFAAEDEINDISISPNGKYIGIATQSYAYLLDNHGLLLHEPFKTLHYAWGVAVSDNGLMAVAATYKVFLYDHSGEIWNFSFMSDPDLMKEVDSPDIAIRSFDVAISPNGKY